MSDLIGCEIRRISNMLLSVTLNSVANRILKEFFFFFKRLFQQRTSGLVCSVVVSELNRRVYAVMSGCMDSLGMAVSGER